MSDDSTLATYVVEGDAPRLEIDAAELKVIAGPDKGATFALGSDSLLLGSDPECEIVLHDPTVSSRHAEIAIRSNGYVIRDLESTNHVYIGALPVLQAALADKLRIRLGNTTMAVRALGRKSIALSQSGRFGPLVAYSPKMRALIAALDQLAASDATVLIEGETGTGKDVVASTLHARSGRATAPFVVVDCGAAHSSLFLAELFGTEKGAFTGADQARAGLLEEAEGGTLFLDEIGELPMELQASLLGVIERRASRRVGGRRENSHDVRIVAATHRNLAEEVRAKRFREDLFFRLAVARVRVPSLRDRREDIPHLVELFANEVGAAMTPELRSLCLAHHWPGNVRELRNSLQRIALGAAPMHGGDVNAATAADVLPLRSILFDASGSLRTLPEARRLASEAFERQYLEEVLGRSAGKVLGAAELSGVSRRFLSRLVVKHGLRDDRDDDD